MSYWTENFKEKHNFKPLNKNIETDICIIGAGLTGLSCGYYLSKKGLNVTIIEKDEVCSKTSGSTTAKITSQHNLFYDYLAKNYGIEFAKDYLEANEEAIKNIKTIVDEEKIKCDLSKQSAYVYCSKKSDLPLFTQEINTINQIKSILNTTPYSSNHLKESDNNLKSGGLSFDARFKKNLNIPIKNFGGIEFKNQAMFNPRKYCFGLVDCILKNNGTIFEKTSATNIKFENNLYKITANNKIITASYVILATHFPIKNFPGIYFIKMYQDISYVIAVKTKEKTFDGYYINESSPAISFRNVYEKAGENTVLISGNGHKVGRTNKDIDCYKFLEDVAKKLFNEYEIISKWSTQDCISLDKLPYIGNFSKILPNIYVATGFKKWGMTLSNISANIITDKILGKENKYEYLFKPSRIGALKNSKAFGEQMKETIYSIGLNKLKLPDETVKDIKEGTGKIVMYNGKKVGAYKDKNGICYLVNPICTHLKCELQFNQTDKTWDCPCHGSRFTYKGQVINNPALFNLKNI